MLTQLDTDGVTVRTIAQLTQVDTDGVTVRTLQSLYQNDADGVPRLVYSVASASDLTPDEVYGYGYSKGTIYVSTSAATVDAPSGATIVWNFADSGWQAVNPGATRSTFRKQVAAEDIATTTITATVTAGGHSYTTNAISASVENNGVN